jgi:hypothetical protein
MQLHQKTEEKKIKEKKNNLKEKLIQLKNNFEIKLARKSYLFHFFIAFLYGWFVGTYTRVKYNGIYDTFITNAFKLSYMGLAWGKTPSHIQILSLIFVVISSLSYCRYIIYVKNKHFYSGIRWN